MNHMILSCDPSCIQRKVNSSRGLLGKLRLGFFSAPRVVEECEIRIMAWFFFLLSRDLGLSDCFSC